jgi:hypothetical protein
VDTKKKELVGDFTNDGREYQPQGAPEQVRVHDFLDKHLGNVIPSLIHRTYGSRTRRFGRYRQGEKIHPNWSVVSRHASREFIPEAKHRSPPCRMPSHHSTAGNYSLPPFRLSARERVPTMPSADF